VATGADSKEHNTGNHFQYFGNVHKCWHGQNSTILELPLGTYRGCSRNLHLFVMVKGEKTQDWNLGLELSSPAKGLFEIPISKLHAGW